MGFAQGLPRGMAEEIPHTRMMEIIVMMDDAERLARALGGRRSGRQFKCRCPTHDDHDPSLLVWMGHKAVQVRCQAGCEPIAVMMELRRRGLWNGVENRTASSFNEKRQAELAARRRQEERERDWMQHRALALWDEAKPALGTEVELYLEWWRGLEVPTAERKHLLTDVLRLHRHCPRGNEGQRQPAMIALMRSIVDNKPQAIHRTFFDPHWAKHGKPMVLGPAGGAAVKLFNGPPCRSLFIAEGIETALALIVRGMVDLQTDAVWAVGSASAIALFPLLEDVGELVIAADRDANGTGERAAAAAVQTWRTAGKRARVLLPEDGKDFAEALRL
jgi:putative DNA primase/helicase